MEIILRDNGIGMTEKDITNFFLTIGKSKTKSQEFISVSFNKKFHPIGRFGVGFWSVFTIATKASIKTRYYKEHNGYKFDVTLEPAMPYLELIKDSTLSIGTTINLKIKEEFDFSRITNYLNNIRATPVPMSIIDGTNNILNRLPIQLPDIKMEDLFSYGTDNAIKSGMKYFKVSYDTDNIEFRLAIAYSFIKGNIHCLTPNNEFLLFVKPFHSYIQSSVCGIATNIVQEDLPFAIDRVGIMIINIKSPAGLDFTFHKEKIEDNKRLREIKYEIDSCMARALREFYNKAGAIGKPEKIGLLMIESRTNGGEVADKRCPGLYSRYQKYYSGLVAFYIWKWKKMNGSIKIEPKWIFIEDFWKLDKPVIYIVLWPFLRRSDKEISYVKNWASKEFNDVYLLVVSYEASAIVDVANKVKVKYTSNPYLDPWDRKTNQYIEILPSGGYSEENNYSLFPDKSIWKGGLSKVEFEQNSVNPPWFVFGRDRIFLDKNHKLTNELERLYSEGNVWKINKLLSLMASRNEASVEEIEKLSGIRIFEQDITIQENSFSPIISEEYIIDNHTYEEYNNQDNHSEENLSAISNNNLNILPQDKTDNETNSISTVEDIISHRRLDDLKIQLDKCPSGKKYFSEYEKIGIEILNYIFKEELEEIKAQATTLDGTQRRDILFKNKRKSYFFKRIYEKFAADFIIVDFKNYEEAIESSVIYDTIKYPNKALGRFILIVSRKGGSNSVLSSQIRIYRDHDVLILVISDKQMIDMVLLKETGKDPSELLDRLLDEVLIKY